MTTAQIFADYLDLERRFYSKISHSNNNGCWIWAGCKHSKGYGCISLDGKMLKATRVSILLATGDPVPAGKLACHHCDNPSCVNPSHLYVGTAEDNQTDSVVRGRHALAKRTHCQNGHEFTPENTYQAKDKRVCRTCQKVYALNYYYNKRKPRLISLGLPLGSGGKRLAADPALREACEGQGDHEKETSNG